MFCTSFLSRILHPEIPLGTDPLELIDNSLPKFETMCCSNLLWKEVKRTGSVIDFSKIQASQSQIFHFFGVVVSTPCRAMSPAWGQ